MVHVHQLLSILFTSSHIATRNLARFVERSRYLRDEREREQADAAARANAVRESYASVLRKVSNKKDEKPEEPKVVPAFMQTNMVSDRSPEDGVEWVLVEQNGKEMAGDEGLPISALIRSWPSRVSGDLKEE